MIISPKKVENGNVHVSRLLKLVSHIQDPYRVVDGWISADITTQTKDITGYLCWVGVLNVLRLLSNVFATPNDQRGVR